MRAGILCGLAAAVVALPAVARAQIGELQATYDFLLRERAAGGVLFSFSNAPLVAPGPAAAAVERRPPTGTYLLPASFTDTPEYWGAFVCGGSRAMCAVTDTYNTVDYQLAPPSSAPGKLQVERVDAHSGANIYDIATWQIAVMVGAVKSHLRIPSPTSAYAFASSPSEVLQQAGRLAPFDVAPGAKRATTAGDTFVYNGRAVTDGRRAYAFRALAPAWLAPDPLMGSPYASWITASNLPAENPAYAAGKITWTDWKPITGENAWAFLIGPLQAAYLHYVVDLKERVIPFSEPAVQNALDVLPTFAAMQSTVGAVYYAPAGTVGNEGDAAVNPHGVSVENNLSLYAGLRLLQATLRAEIGSTAEEKNAIAGALHLVDVMIDGGHIDQGGATKGLLSFFKNAAWRNGAFVQGGLADDPTQAGGWIASTAPQAVDVQTWGIAALGTKQIDAWFGPGAAFELWQQLKSWGAYGVGKTLWGVGYSDQDGNGIGADGAYRQGVMSGEWTAGAIDAVRNMIATYDATPAGRKYVAILKDDEAAMLAAIEHLRIDRYGATDFPGKPAEYAKLIATGTKPYLYASRRYHIPFGWYANPLPSTASTAWVIMIANRYDPFGIGGAPN
jgi:hypothetical protein